MNRDKLARFVGRLTPVAMAVALLCAVAACVEDLVRWPGVLGIKGYVTCSFWLWQAREQSGRVCESESRPAFTQVE